jgi:hypothetical protein
MSARSPGCNVSITVCYEGSLGDCLDKSIIVRGKVAVFNDKNVTNITDFVLEADTR